MYKMNHTSRRSTSRKSTRTKTKPKRVMKGGAFQNLYTEYTKNFEFFEKGPNIQTQKYFLMEKMLTNIVKAYSYDCNSMGNDVDSNIPFNTLDTNTYNTISDVIFTSVNSQIEEILWKSRSGMIDVSDKLVCPHNKNCYNTLNPFCWAEVDSTIYHLRCIADSLVSSQGNQKVVFIIKDSSIELTGVWESDKNNIRIQSYGGITPSHNGCKLIMALGPSEMGKLVWSEKLIKLFSLVYEFPKSFLRIHKDIYRKASIMYSIMHDSITMARQGVFPENSLNVFFNFDRIQIRILEYLQIYSETYYNIYACETNLTDNQLNVYKKITHDTDSWIGVSVWEHNSETECKFTNEYKCEGCPSKRYKMAKINDTLIGCSQDNWNSMMVNAYKYISGKSERPNGIGIQLWIHHSSKKSVVQDFTPLDIIPSINNLAIDPSPEITLYDTLFTTQNKIKHNYDYIVGCTGIVSILEPNRPTTHKCPSEKPH